MLESPFNKRRLQRRCFPINIAKFLRAPFLWTLPVAASVIRMSNEIFLGRNIIEYHSAFIPMESARSIPGIMQETN